jgi:hypothetical protein
MTFSDGSFVRHLKLINAIVRFLTCVIFSERLEVRMRNLGGILNHVTIFLAFSNRGHHCLGPLMNCFVL